MKYILSLFMTLAVFLSAKADPNWKMHTTFDEEVTRVIDTGDAVYFTGRTQPYNPKLKACREEILSLFRFDKDSEEIQSLSTDNLLSSNTISNIEYSPEKGMLVVVYTNSDIDLIYDNGKTVNIPAYKLASLTTGKKVNSIFIDAPLDRIYLATEFGYVALNDKKAEVAESRIYNKNVMSVSRTGEDLWLLTDNELLSAPLSSPRFNLTEYRNLKDVNSGKILAKLSDAHILMIDCAKQPQTLYLLSKEGDGITAEEISSATFSNVNQIPSGVTLSAPDHIYKFSNDGKYEKIAVADADRRMVAGTHNGTEYWFGSMRKGIMSRKYDVAGDNKWTLTREFIRPNSPAPYRASEMAVHPEYGLLVVNHGFDRNFTEASVNSPILLSAYKNGEWSNLSPVYTNPGATPRIINPNGLAVDPDNKDLVYFGSPLNGLERINMKDGTDILHLSRTKDPSNKLPGFVEIVPEQKGEPSPAIGGEKSWVGSCVFSAPAFDSHGNLWTMHSDMDDQTPLKAHLYCWESEDRKASVDAESYRPMKLYKIEGPSPTNTQLIMPLTTPKYSNIVLFTTCNYDGEIVCIDTNGTPGDFSDDKIVRINKYYDQDGNQVEAHHITCLYEDPLTGNVWAGHGTGVFYFNPSDFLEGKGSVRRIKVARDDGTNLADYLLNLVKVNKIASDGSGRKWFATSGAGVVCTSSDGRKIEEEWTTENSPLPADIVYGLCYVPENNSMMISSENGIAEYFLSSTGSRGSDDTARAYPNPVRPDYFGYVTIDGLQEDSIVKIVDSAGHLIKELETVSGGKTQWDVTDLSFRRVSSGIYFILSSAKDNSNNEINVGKILVVN